MRTWQFAADRGQCPDCDDVISTGSIPAHVAWHIGLRDSFVGGGAQFDHIVELFNDAVGELTWMVHELQIARLRQDDR